MDQLIHEYAIDQTNRIKSYLVHVIEERNKSINRVLCKSRQLSDEIVALPQRVRARSTTRTEINESDFQPKQKN